MEKRTFDGGYAQADKKELSKYLAEDETTVLGLSYEEYADVFYYTPAFKEITKKIEECYANTDSCTDSTYKLNDRLAVTLKVLPAANGAEKELAMTLVNNDNKEIFKLVKNISGAEAGGQDRTHKGLIGFMTEWITKIADITKDETKPILFWLLDQDYESVHDMLEPV